MITNTIATIATPPKLIRRIFAHSGNGFGGVGGDGGAVHFSEQPVNSEQIFSAHFPIYIYIYMYIYIYILYIECTIK